MRYTIQINDKNEIRIWDNDNPNELNAPFLYQPDWPDGTAWANKEEAQAWADLFVESLQNPESEYLAGNNPAEPKKSRPLPEPEEI